jgi:hypothetical protein
MIRRPAGEGGDLDMRRHLGIAALVCAALQAASGKCGTIANAAPL